MKIQNKLNIEKNKLIESLRKKGIDSENVLEAIAAVPREKFVDPKMIEMSYEDRALPINEKQTISQPYTVAFMTMHLDIEEGMKVLEIGTGSGYQTAILASMGADVYSIERIPSLFSNTSELLASLGYQAHLFLKDGTTGLDHRAPFDRILITAGAPEEPLHLLDQLTDNGKIVVPVGDEKSQIMKVIIKNKSKHQIIDLSQFKFVPLVGEKGWKQKEN